jgi:hypothetical protein
LAIINIELKLKLKIKIPNQNLKELINIKIVLVKGTLKGKSPIKFNKTKTILIHCIPDLKDFDLEYKTYPKTNKTKTKIDEPKSKLKRVNLSWL